MDAEKLKEIVRLHGAWLREKEGGARAYLSGALLTAADLRYVNLWGAYLTGADLTGACLTGAYLTGACLTRADLTGASLTCAYLTDADFTGADLAGASLACAHLTGADLDGAYLTGADLSGANLSGADLTGVDLAGAYLAGADLTGATMPDGRAWDVYRADHLAGICTEPEVIARAVAAWGTHAWSGCPMHAALGIDRFDDIDDCERRRLVACWVALYDAGLLDVSGAR